MKVKMLSRCAGPMGNFSPNEEVTLPDDFAEALIEAKAAVSLGPSEPVVERTVEIESAVAPGPAEAAVVTPKRKGFIKRSRKG